MKKKQKFVATMAALLMVGMLSTGAMAATSYDSPTDALAGVTGKSVQEITEQVKAGESLGQIAQDEGKLKEYQAALLELKEQQLDEMVEAGTIDRTYADQYISNMQNNQYYCNGTGLHCNGMDACGWGVSGTSRSSNGTSNNNYYGHHYEGYGHGRHHGY